MNLLWTHKAAADLDGIYDHYVVLIGPEKALKAIQDIVGQIRPLGGEGQGSSGKASEVPGVRELPIDRWPFVTAFRVKGRNVEILRVDRVENTA